MKKYITPWNAFFFLMGLMWAFIIYDWFRPFHPVDDTDFPDHQSGMWLYTDHLTGCQYLYRGSLTPRMDADGKQICIRIET